MLLAGPNLAARVVRVGAALVLLAIFVSSVLTAKHDDVLVTLALLGVYLFGFLVITGRWASVPARGLVVGGVTGVGGVVLPAVFFMVWPPAPVSGGWAVATAALAGVVAGAVTTARATPAAGVFAGLLAVLVVALLLPTAVSLLAQVGPESWVPRLGSHALTPASRLAERRQLAAEDYLPALLIGDLLALVTPVFALQTRVRRRLPETQPRQIDLAR